jgi:hypothetical protein
MPTRGSCNMLLCGLLGGFDSALHASANSFFHMFTATLHFLLTPCKVDCVF